MPIYEYICDNCEHKIEIFQKISDTPFTQCPACNQETMRKLVSSVAFQLKGTGWYETDFKHKTTSDNKDSKDDTKDNKTATQDSADSSKSADKSAASNKTEETTST